MSLQHKSKYRIYKSDAAPFFFFIDVLSLERSQYQIKHHQELLKSIQYNPIMPLPLRVDRVTNGVSSTMVRPRNPISFSVGENFTAIFNPNPFLRYGMEKLLILTEIRVSEQFACSLSPKNARKWWDATRFIYGRLKTFEDDFTAFLHAYLHFVLEAKTNNADLVSASIKYCELIKELCNKRINEKYYIIENHGKEKIVDLYKMKEGMVQQKAFKFSRERLLYPSFVDVELIDARNMDFPTLLKVEEKKLRKYLHVSQHIPLLIYDDLLECMLQNLKALKSDEVNILDPSFLLDNKIILLVKNNEISSDQFEKYIWLKSFDDIDINSILDSIRPTFR